MTAAAPGVVADQAAELHARFTALVLPHLDRLLGFARRRVDAAADAEDAVQETCIRAWLAFGELRDVTRVRPWLYRILRGVLSDAREKYVRRQQLVSITRLDDAYEELVGGADELFAEVVARISSDLVHDALAAIPEDFAVAVELHDIDGMKYHEVAEIMGVPIGTVMSRIYRGRRLLGSVIAARHGGSQTTDAASAGPLSLKNVAPSTPDHLRPRRPR